MKTLTVRREKDTMEPTIKLRDTVIANQEEFCYLGRCIILTTASLPMILRLKRRIAMAKRAFNNKYNLQTNKKFDVNTRKECIKSCLLLYGCETWTTRQYEKKIARSYQNVDLGEKEHGI